MRLDSPFIQNHRREADTQLTFRLFTPIESLSLSKNEKHYNSPIMRKNSSEVCIVPSKGVSAKRTGFGELNLLPMSAGRGT